jgi:hypothetical protein
MLCLASITFLHLAQDTCYPYLDSENTYYLGDSDWLDDTRGLKVGGSAISFIIDIFENVMKKG